MMLNFKFVILVLMISQGADVYGLNVLTALERQEKRGNLCDTPYMETIVAFEENLVDCLHSTYYDRCKNIRCHRTYGDKCGDFPGASQTQRLYYGKCKEPYFCHKGICRGEKHHHHHASIDNDHQLHHQHHSKRDPEMNFNKYPYRSTSSVESDIYLYNKDDDGKEEDYDFLGDVIYRFREGRILDTDQRMKDGELGEKLHDI